MAIDRDSYTTDTEAVTITATSGGASATSIYTCPPSHDATIDFLHISNGSTSTQNVTVQWYHADTNTYHHIVNDKAIAGKDVYNIITADRLHLHAGDKIVVYGETANTIEVIVSVEEYYNPQHKG